MRNLAKVALDFDTYYSLGFTPGHSGSGRLYDIKVQVRDASGNLVTTATNTITLSIGTNPSSGTLSGTLARAAVAGVATFNDISIDKVGTGYTLDAAASGLSSAGSAAWWRARCSLSTHHTSAFESRRS